MQIAQALRQATRPFVSLEFFPPAEECHLPEFYKTVERLRSVDPLFLSVTYGAGGGKQQNTLDVTAELARRGFTVMAHLTCVGAEPQAISDFVGKLRRAGVHNVLALRGDAPRARAAGTGTRGISTMPVISCTSCARSIPTWASLWRDIPRPIPMRPPSPRIGPIWPTSCAPGRTSSSPSFFFDVREYESLVSSLRAAGLEAPVIPGILPIQSFDSLRRVLSLCGANIPGKLYLELEAAHNKGGVEAVRRSGSCWIAARPASICTASTNPRCACAWWKKRACRSRAAWRKAAA